MKIWPWALGFGALVWLSVKRAAAFPVDEPDEVPADEPSNPVPPKIPLVLSPDTHLSTHFQYKEFSQHACPKQGLSVTPYPAGWVEDRLMPLVLILETVRSSFGGKSITINSAYRSPTYNKLCIAGGATTSQHVYGRAVDIVVAGVSAHVIHDRVLALYNQGKIQIGGLGRYNTFTHIDIRPGNRLARWG